MLKRIITLFLLTLSLTNLTSQIITNESLQSLRITGVRIDKKDTTFIITGTGFIIRSKTKYYLITNEHIATNKQRSTGKWVVSKVPIYPNHIFIEHRSSLGVDYFTNTLQMIDSGGIKKYKNYKMPNGEILDIVAIPLESANLSKYIKIYPVDFEQDFENIKILPSDIATVVGYPHGKTFDFNFPIWKTGRIASEPDIDQGGKPIMYLDLLGYTGMSGSPVYYITNHLITKKNSQYIGDRNVIFLGVIFEINEELNLSIILKSTYLKRWFQSFE
jgi:hypothetical protein